MSLDTNAVGAETRVHEMSYDWRDLALYALGIGAKRDELDYLYEKRGPVAYPSFAVVPAYPILTELLELTKGPYDQVLHSGQSVRILRPIPPQGVLKTKGTITGIYDIKVLAQVEFTTTTTLDDEPLFETEWHILFRGEGGFGGPRRPRRPPVKVPPRDPDWVFDERVSEEQALLYRLSGDPNPLHADPEFARSVGFEQGPILHGLCTFGFVCRAIAKSACGGDATRIKSLSAQFKKPVWPGEALETRGYVEDGAVIAQSFAGGRPDPVIADCRAELSAD